MQIKWFNGLKSLFIIFVLGAASLAGAQQQGQGASKTTMKEEIRSQVLELLSLDCGVNGGLKEFKAALNKIPVDVAPFLIKILQEGLPEDVRNDIRDRSRANYEQRRAWLKKNGADLFDSRTIIRLLERNPDTYIADTIRSITLRYQENSIRGLGHIGKTDAIRVIENAARQEPGFAMLAKQAINTINKRTSQ